MRMRREGPRWMRSEAPGRDTRDDRGIEEEDGMGQGVEEESAGKTRDCGWSREPSRRDRYSYAP